MDVNEVADNYFRCVRARDLDGLAALYAKDAVFIAPNGMQVSGVQEIREFQAKVFAHGGPLPEPGPRIAGENCIAVEIEATLADGSTRRTANFFYLNEAGRIQRLSVYARAG